MESWERPQKSEMLTSQTSNFYKVAITHSTRNVESLHKTTVTFRAENDVGNISGIKMSAIE